MIEVGKLAVLLFLLYLQLTVWHSKFAGILLFVVYLWFVGEYWRCVLHRIFGMKYKDWMTVVFSFFTVFTLLGLFSSVLVVWYKLTPMLLWSVYLTLAIFSYLLFLIVKKKRKRGLSENGKKKFGFVMFKKNNILLGIFLLLASLIFFLLLKSNGTEVLNSPWQSIDKLVLPLTFLSIFVLGILVCSKHKIKTLLFLIIVQSLVMHLYLPLSHEMPWGGDVWRHVAVENQLLGGQSVLPVLFGDEASWREVAGIDVPEALVVPHKYLYGHLWGSGVLLSATLDIDLLAVNKWMMVFLWSIVLPIVLLRIGRIMFGSWRAGLFFSFLSLIPFTLQALGSLALPVSLGLLFFLFTLMLWLQYLDSGGKRGRNLALFFAVSMLFGYTLYFILIWFVILISLFFKNIDFRGNKIFRKITISFSTIFAILFFPIIEIVSRASHLPQSWDFVNQIKQMLGQFSGWYYASAIRPHDMLSGNILINHTPDYAFVSSFFTDWRWPMMLGVSIIFGLAIFGLWRSLYKKKIVWLIFNLFATSIVAGYLIGWFFLEGDRSFVRRLDPIFSIVIFVYFVFGLSKINFEKMRARYRNVVILSLVVLFSWVGTTSFATGPDMRVVSLDEYNAANYVWKHKNEDSQCVLANTWILLALESRSSQKIVGGGFPIDYQFAQEKRVSLLSEMIENPEQSVLSEISNITGHERCWVVLPIKDVDEEKEAKMSEFSSSTPEQLGDFLIWNIDLKK